MPSVKIPSSVLTLVNTQRLIALELNALDGDYARGWQTDSFDVPNPYWHAQQAIIAMLAVPLGADLAHEVYDAMSLNDISVRVALIEVGVDFTEEDA